MRCLVLDNHQDRDAWGAQALRRMAQQTLQKLGLSATVETRRALAGDLPWERGPAAYTLTLISGSGASCLEESDATRALDEWIRQTITGGRALLGVCYGHQALCRAVARSTSGLRRGGKAQIGWNTVRITKNTAPLFEGFSAEFSVFQRHVEEVARLAPELQSIASSKDCAVEAVQYREHPVYGIQFHPEKSESECLESITSMKKNSPNIPLLETDPKRYFNSEVGEKIFVNFFKHACKSSKQFSK